MILSVVTLFLSGTAQSAVVCHLPPDDPGNQKTLIVGDAAIADHLLHGDSLGACGCPTVACDYTPLHVREGAKGRMDGTEANPFGTIEKALKFAEKSGLTCVDLQLKAGFYSEDVIRQTLNLKIAGLEPGVILATEVSNNGPYSLSLSDLKFVNAPGGDEPAISVANECADTTLQNVVVENIEGVGLRQQGGMVLMDGVTMRQTSLTESSSSGSAISLENGVSACIGDATLSDNDRSGLSVSGQGTQVLIYDAAIERNGVTEAESLTGGISISLGAVVLGQDLAINENMLTGIVVEQSSRASFRDTSVARTQGPDGITVVGVYVDNSSELEMSYAALCESQLVGALLDSTGTAAVALLTNTLVANNPIGLSIEGSGDGAQAQLLTCIPASRFVNNEINVDALFLPPPRPFAELNCSNGIDDDLDGDIDCADNDCADSFSCVGSTLCPQVSFAPTWCDTNLSMPVAVPICPDPL